LARRRARNKLYILDTNVLLHDPQCLFRFEEHDIYIPFVTLEELDNKKQGTQDVNRNARQATRLIADVASQPGKLQRGFLLKSFNGKKATGRMFLQDKLLPFLKDEHLRKNDNQYLAVLKNLRTKRKDSDVILVSKDINLRIKARGMGFIAEDYKNDQVIEDADLLSRGWHAVGPEFLEEAGDALESWKLDGRNYYRVPQKTKKIRYLRNEMILLDALPFMVSDSNLKTLELRQAEDYSKSSVWGVNARNPEQNLALNLLLNPEVDFVTLLGPAGTGKTLLTLAAALEQVVERKLFAEIIFTRATVPMGEDIGFLPGTEEEKMLPWMGALHDNIEVLVGGRPSGKEGHASKWEHSTTTDLVSQHVNVKAMTFMRGRTFNAKFLIIDEAQNLTAKQMKSLITRAGPGTKVVCMGNLAQIDTPYLSEANSGLAYAAECFKGWDHYGQVILSQGERSRLASYANDHM
jgi:PhoH-like ATPase